MYSKTLKLIRSNEKVEKLFRKIFRVLILLPLFRIYFRRNFALSYYKPKIRQIRRWAFKQTENDNFYYSLSQKNLVELGSMISIVTGKSRDEIDIYFKEIEKNQELHEHIESIWANDPKMQDAVLGFGRRVGWYALARALKPRVIVETGVHHGVGACVLISALMKNSSEGFHGNYYGTDIDPNAGVLLSGDFKEFGKILYGDSITSIKNFGQDIDFFINDSDHSEIYEAQEYEIVKSKLASNSIILGDNSHVTDKLSKFARKNDRPYIFFKEEPLNHWYPGAGIGISPTTIPLKLVKS